MPDTSAVAERRVSWFPLKKQELWGGGGQKCGGGGRVLGGGEGELEEIKSHLYKAYPGSACTVGRGAEWEGWGDR